MTSTFSPVQYRGDYINGQFVLADRPDGEFRNSSPADLKESVSAVEYRYDHVQRATEAAQAAFLPWARLKPEDRFHFLQRVKELYLVKSKELAQLIARETGKPLWDAEGEAKAMAAKVDITLGHSQRHIQTETFPDALPGVTGEVVYNARGVMAVLGPFNFPGHLPNGHIIPALATGNTVVFKPSELTPMVGQFMAEIFHEAGLPRGVFNLVQGDGETGRRLVADDRVDGVLFTGSYETGLKIKQKTLEQHWKILALEMGGKNATIVWSDADLNKAVYETTIGAFMTSGQRCSCTSRILLHESIADRFIEKFYETAKKLTIGHWSENPFMGPLINATSVEKYLRFQEIASREGAERLMRGKVLDLDRKGHYVTPSICLVDAYKESSVYQKSEIFGPNVAIYRVNDFDQALQINASTGFGLVTSLFSRDRKLFEEARLRARSGLVNWNRTTNGASSKLPFGGFGKSGNDRPSADFAVQYCTVPVASLQDESPFELKNVPPGLSYDPF